MLYDPDRFEPLTETPWVEAWVRAAIADIVADADTAFDSTELWPADEWDAWSSPTPLKTLYVGAAGVAWALHALRVQGAADSGLDLSLVARTTLEAWRKKPGVLTTLDLPAPANASLFMGETGILAVLFEISPDEAVAGDLLALVEANVENDANEVMWGAPGTMLVAETMASRTGDQRWLHTWHASADELWHRRDAEGLWTQRLYGGEARSLTPPHGLVGNVQALLRGPCTDDRRVSLLRDAAATLRRTAVIEEGLANWPDHADGPLQGGDREIRLQWCSGAPGIVASAGAYLDEDLLLAGAQLVWKAGPHGSEKGPCICHGTAGNGYALLKAFERTADERWLERARRFAVHALEQVVRLRDARGHGRYSLWTGDVGVALYAADCLAGTAAYPVLETRD